MKSPKNTRSYPKQHFAEGGDVLSPVELAKKYRTPSPQTQQLRQAVEKIGPDEEWAYRIGHALKQAGRGYSEFQNDPNPRGYGPGTGLPRPGAVEDEIRGSGSIPDEQQQTYPVPDTTPASYKRGGPVRTKR
jgi:hypothetical protein